MIEVRPPRELVVFQSLRVRTIVIVHGAQQEALAVPVGAAHVVLEALRVGAIVVVHGADEKSFLVLPFEVHVVAGLLIYIG